MPKTRPAFSLVEFLVVIAILMLLAGVLLPVLLRARRQAQMTTCVSNQRHIAAAALLWAGEHGDTLPPAATCWRELALPAKTLRCLAAPRQPYGYVYSARVAGKALGELSSPERCLLTGDGESADHLAHTSADFAPRHYDQIVAAYADGHAALATPPRDALLVVGTRWGQQDRELLVVGKDGRVQQVLARGGSISEPACSPDGQHIACVWLKPNAGVGLYVMNSDGTDQRQLLDMQRHDYRNIQWSSDSQTLAFSYQEQPSYVTFIATMRLKDQTPRLLTGPDLSCGSPIFNPDGRTIIFSASPVDHSMPRGLYRMQIDGTGIQRLPIARGRMASISPDGRELIFVSNDSTDPYRSKLCICDVDGGEVRTLYTAAGGLYYPQFSPDGHTIAFVMSTDVGGLYEKTAIALLESTTGQIRQFTTLSEQYNLPRHSFCWYPW